MFSSRNFFGKAFLLFFVSLALIFTACQPIASDVGGSPSSPNGGSSSGGGSKTVTLTLDLDGGTGIEPFIKGEENSAVTPPQNPTRRGYDFQKWEPVLPATFTKQASTKQYVAVWKAKNVTYTLYNKDKTSVYKTLTGDHDTNITRPDAPAPDLANRMFFDKWEPELPEKFDVDKPTEYVAKYKSVPNENVVLTLKLEGGTLPAEQNEHPQGKQGDALSVQNPTKTGYTFTGWSPNLPATFPATNETYTAQWQAKTYAVKYNSNGGGTAPADTSRTYGQSFKLAASAGMSKTGYDFTSWKKDNAGTAYGSGATITDAVLTQIDGEITFWAEWTPHTYSVTYNTNGATSGSPSKTTDTHIYGKDYTLATQNDLQKTGYTFKGWTTTSDGSSTLYAAGTTTSDAAIKNRTSDITFYAKWEVASYSITYNLDSGTNPTGTKTAYTIADATFSLPTPTKSGYTFKGWYENNSFTGSAVTQIAKGSTGNRTFWAKWEVAVSTMTIDQAIAAIKALPSGQTLNVVLGSDTTQAVYDNKGSSLKIALQNCQGKVNLDMSKTGITSIAINAFDSCRSLASVNIPDGVTSIGDWAFNGCTSLASVSIPDGVTTIGNTAFSGCTSLASVSIPDGVTTIGIWAFYGCTLLASVSIGNGVTSIGEYTFYGCTSLASVSIPDGVTSIGDWAFNGCTSLASVSIGNGVTSIGGYTFNGCTSLASVSIPDGVTSIGDRAFNGCTSLASVSIGNGVTSIGEYTFGGCTSLTNVVIPDGVTSIGEYAFYYCTSLASVSIPDGVISIGDCAFNVCTSLASVNIGNSVTSIGGWVFAFCTSLATINYVGTKNDWNKKISSFGFEWRYNIPAQGVTCSDGYFTFASDGHTLQ